MDKVDPSLQRHPDWEGIIAITEGLLLVVDKMGDALAVLGPLVLHARDATTLPEPEPEPEPEPITCCGEWTWDIDFRYWRKRRWEKGNDAVSYSPLNREAIFVCRECHRALLEDGEMTQPLKWPCGR